MGLPRWRHSRYSAAHDAGHADDHAIPTLTLLNTMKTWKIICLAVLALLSVAIVAILNDQKKTREAEARNREFDRAYDRTKASLDRAMATSLRNTENIQKLKRSHRQTAILNEMADQMKRKLEESKAVTAELHQAEPGSLERLEAKERLGKILVELKSMQAQAILMGEEVGDMQADLNSLQKNE